MNDELQKEKNEILKQRPRNW